MKSIKKEARILVLKECSSGFVVVVFRSSSIEDLALIPSKSFSEIDFMDRIKSMKSYLEIRYAVSPLDYCMLFGKLGIECIYGSRALEIYCRYRVMLDKLCRLLDRLYESISYGFLYSVETLI